MLADILGPSLLAGIGLGLSFVPVTIAAVAGVQERDAGLASGLINTSQQVGGALGLAVLATIADSRTSSLMSSGHGPLKYALTQGFHSAFLTGAGFAVLGFAAVPGPDPPRGLARARRGGSGSARLEVFRGAACAPRPAAHAPAGPGRMRPGLPTSELTCSTRRWRRRPSRARRPCSG